MSRSVPVLDDLAIRRQIRRLAMVYKPPEDVDSLTKGWKLIFGDRISERELSDAVLDYMRSDARYFPKPGQLLQAITNERARSYGDRRLESSDWNQLQEGPCPVCGASLRLLTASEQGIPDDQVWHPRLKRWVPVGSEGAPELREVKRFGILHDVAAHERAKVPFVGYGR